MADSAVSYVIQKLVDLLLHEANLLQGARWQFEALQAELKRMQCFLKDADSKQADERVRNWVSEIRDVAYAVEDLIDTFILKVKYCNTRGFVERYASIFKYWSDIYNVGKEIENIRLRIQDISRSRETYGIRNIGEGMSSASSERLRDLRRSSPRGLEKDIVGFEEDTAKLVGRLVKREDRQRPVISIVGMGGLGKTTLAKKVYNHGDVRLHFAWRAWVYVSQDCRSRDILQGILRQISNTPTEELQLKQEEELEAMLYDDLEAKRYLVVLDDIWTKEAWDCLARAFPNTSNGSRLMLTTRNREVSFHADAQSIPHELRSLSKDNSWELFRRKAFLDTHDTSCPAGLEDIGREIVAKCGGVPLAIIVIGGLLTRKKRLPSEWQSVLDNLRSHFAGDQAGTSAILDLSYNDLPYYLKACFLYLAHFPEDYVIGVRKLLQLWMAEGLIPQEGERIGNIAEDCLDELIDRNLVQAVRLSANEKIMSCRIHDLMRELSISKAQKEIFLEIYENRYLSLPAKTRHLAVHSKGSMYFESPPLRSLLVFHSRTSIKINIICTRFKLLRALDMENVEVCELPREIGNLINLRYLSLRNSGITKLPWSMSYLQSLQTLDIRGLEFKKIPKVISKLENLRHLHISPLWKVGQLKIDTLRRLETVSEINVLNWNGNNSKMLSNILKLRVVAKADSTDDDFLKFFNSIADLEHLSSLHLQTTAFHHLIPSLRGGLSSLHHLTKLHLDRIWGMQPSLLEFPQNLFQLTLKNSSLDQTDMEVLGKLPKLCILSLRNCSTSVDENQLTFSANGFSQLNILVLDTFHKLEEFNVEEGAMPRLKHLRISCCNELISLPQGIKFLSTLLELEIEGMPQSFEDKLRGEDSYKIHQIPSTIFREGEPVYEIKVGFKVMNMTDEETKQKAIQAAADIPGVNLVTAELKDQKLTVIGHIDTETVTKTLQEVGMISIHIFSARTRSISIPLEYQPPEYQPPRDLDLFIDTHKKKDTKQLQSSAQALVIAEETVTDSTGDNR